MADGTTSELLTCLERVRAGDAEARGQLVARALDRLQRLTRKLLGDFARVRRYEETDDVLQNALLRLLRRLEKHAPATGAEFFALAAREIRRELIDLARHYYGPLGAGRREVPAPDADTGASAPPGLDAGQSTHSPDRLAQWREFHEAVERLPEEERAAFDLLWYHGLTQKEAAEVIGVSEPTVKRRWLAARLRLRAVLGDGAGL